VEDVRVPLSETVHLIDFDLQETDNRGRIVFARVEFKAARSLRERPLQKPNRSSGAELARAVIVAGEEVAAPEPAREGTPDIFDQEFFGVRPDCAAE
jgi:hypothetical protein